MVHFIGFHGLGCSKKSFELLARELERKGHKFSAYDYRGFGERTFEQPSDDPFTDAVKEALAYTQGEEKISIIAHSMGAVVALMLAEQIPPDKIDQVIVIEGNLTPHDGGNLSRKLKAAKDDKEVEDLKAGLIAQMSHSDDAGWRYWAEDVADVTPYTLRTYATALVEASDSGDMMRIFQSLECKKLYIHGDSYVGHDTLSELGSIPVVHLEGTSHFPIIEQPEMCARKILENGQYAPFATPSVGSPPESSLKKGPN